MSFEHYRDEHGLDTETLLGAARAEGKAEHPAIEHVAEGHADSHTDEDQVAETITAEK